MKKYKVVKKIKEEGFPTSSKRYKYAHKQADIDEKKKYPKGYERMKKIDEKLKPHELSGKSTKSGKIYVSKKVPKKLRPEVAEHERYENMVLRKKRKKK